MTTLTEVVRHPVVKEKFGLLAQAAELVASPQIRNQGTIGGNVSQDTRCWYYRAGWTCYRAGGNICYADTPDGRNREHAILDADRCVAVNPSDTAPALIALDAQMVIRTPKGERVVDAEDYFIGPGIDITRMNVLQPGRAADGDSHSGDLGGRAVLLREGARPARVGLPAGERGVGDEGCRATRFERIRMVVNGVAARPLRLKAVEDAVRGKPRNAATGEMAGKLAVQGADAAAVQRLQDPADAEPGEARHPRRAGGSMDIIEWATSPWGRTFPPTSRGP